MSQKLCKNQNRSRKIITVDAACTASFDPRANTVALDSMESIQINVINRKDK